ncbi:MAG: hypothetical protein KJ941_02790, partial [Bacteroidetes bacterium]|nr:hypothetical protein [Bacteroidota bacterium]
IAFPLPGNWTAEVQEWDNNVLSSTFSEFKITVKNSDHPGFVKVHRNKKNLERGGKMIFPVGANLFSPVVDNNLYYSGNPKDQLNVSSWDKYHKDVRRYEQEGGKYLRFIMEPTASEIEFEKVGNYYDRLNLAWEMDQFLDFAEEKDLLVEWNCMIQSPFKVFDQEFQSWDFLEQAGSNRSAYAYSKEFNLSLPSEIFTNPEAFKYFKERYRYIVARWGYSPQIYFFELISEPFWLNRDDRTGITPYDDENESGELRGVLSDFHSNMAEYIKVELQHTQHLLAALNHVPSPENQFYPHSKSPIQDESWASPHIDIISMNMYKGIPSHFHFEENSVLAYQLQELQAHYQKPLFLSETQIAENLSVCSDRKLLPLDVMTTGFIGIAGFNIWETFFYNEDKNATDFDDRINWSWVIGGQKFMENHVASILEKDSGDWKVYSFALPDKQRLFTYLPDVLESHWYVSEGGNFGAGVLMNRTYNVYTNRISDETECNQYKAPEGTPSAHQNTLRNLGAKKNKMSVDHLTRKTKFQITFYDYISNKSIGFDRVKSNRRGVIKFRYPVLSVTKDEPLRPAIWLVVEPLNENL